MFAKLVILKEKLMCVLVEFESIIDDFKVI